MVWDNGWNRGDISMSWMVGWNGRCILQEVINRAGILLLKAFRLVNLNFLIGFNEFVPGKRFAMTRIKSFDRIEFI